MRRELPSDHCELAPVAAPQLAAYGSEGQTTAELQLALAELADEARPATVARFLLPDGVRLEEVELPIGRPELPGRLGREHPVTVTVAIVPDVRDRRAHRARAHLARHDRADHHFRGAR